MKRNLLLKIDRLIPDGKYSDAASVIDTEYVPFTGSRIIRTEFTKGEITQRLSAIVITIFEEVEG